MPEVGPHPEGLKTETGEIDPPPEDLGNADEASIVTILWTMSLCGLRLETRPHSHNRLLLGSSSGSSR